MADGWNRGTMIYDAFQQKAIDIINSGQSVLVSAPTGAGKTVIAEHVILTSLQQKSKVVYTAPIKALSNQKYRDFQTQFPDSVGILTGDVSINPNAPALIMTTEIFRNKIVENKETLRDYSWVIFDEIHYLDDYERGTVWEEALILMPDHMNILGLSATVPNIEQLGRWIEKVHGRPVKIVKEHRRPVPLHFFYQCQNEIYDDFQKFIKNGYRGVIPARSGQERSSHSLDVKPNRLSTLVKHLKEKGMLPCIYFVFSRKRTEYLAQELQHFNFLDNREEQDVRAMYDELCERFDLTAEASAAKLRPFVERGMAYHHAGMLPTLKEVVERLFTSRLIKVIFTTETFALGINMPARTVVFDEMRKFYGRSFSVMKTRDFYQMAGRAGRRSIDQEGFVFCRVNPFQVSARNLHDMIYNMPEQVSSRFNLSYATILNLFHQYQDHMVDIYPRSLHFYQEKKISRSKAVRLLQRKMKVLKDMKYIQDGELTEKGLFASRVYGYELILSELFSWGIFDKLSLMELGVLCIAVVYEPRKGAQKPKLRGQTKVLERITSDAIKMIHKVEKRADIKPLSKMCCFHLAEAMEGWIKGESFDRILQYSDADEGEVVRYFRMVLQVLRELQETPLPDQAKDQIGKLARIIDRDVVDSERQLRG